jgi:hypothetical protein
MSAELEDEATPWEAFVRVCEAIQAVPEGARVVDVTLGRRSASAGHGWYWNVSWTMSIGTLNHLPPEDWAFRKAAVALLDAVGVMDRCPEDGCDAVLTPGHHRDHE